MAELATIARPYAEALFRVAQNGDLTAWSDALVEMSAFAAHPDLVALAHNPKVSAEQKAETFLSVLRTPLTAEIRNFVQTLTANDRLPFLPEIATQFHALKNAQEGAADAHIVSAFALSETQIAELTGLLEKKFGRKLHPHVQIDADLIGGVRVVVGDQVLDTSVRAKLQKMQQALTA